MKAFRLYWIRILPSIECGTGSHFYHNFQSRSISNNYYRIKQKWSHDGINYFFLHLEIFIRDGFGFSIEKYYKIRSRTMAMHINLQVVQKLNLISQAHCELNIVQFLCPPRLLTFCQHSKWFRIKFQSHPSHTRSWDFRFTAYHYIFHWMAIFYF